MAAGRRLTWVAAVAIACALIAPLAHGDEPVLPETAVASESAERMPAWQISDTQPPPVTALGDSLEVPADSGSGRRVVYSKTVMRVWLIEEDGGVYHTHRVSGLDTQPKPGTYAVWSRSPSTCSNASPDICMRWMVRFAHSFRGDNIGFHEIPSRRGVPLQDLSQLGLALSGGCVRQSTDDALVMWDWAQIGTVVVVVG